ncbi:E3 ubiquitin-protein ligase RNF10 [Vanessa tameamea]|uniref:E3 ubiquitin-protein ligase RNF10 n=1 Tax=Vanessa tameamea TaxID=334116 RepID=A0A8B8ICV4_VANTA|nr:RING finger protein 10 [Vanessa tameamea]
MLEESRMDKKSINRSVLQQSRASAIDCKKSTELTHKPWPRSNKKREVSGSIPKNEPNRKNIPSQRGRGQMDKRPRARGSADFIVGGTPNARLEEDDEPEIGSVFTPGSKKQNLNHLLNFMYPTRAREGGRGPTPRRPGQQRFSYKHEHDLYLRAYCQFVVKEDGDYKLNLMDPDLPLKWELIEEIVVRSTGRSECPICLGAPIAGRVGHCGHVYCWACILHYAAAHEKQPPPCPVCATSLQVSDMKPTRIVQWESPADEVTMRLVRRLRGSTIVEVAPPRGQIKDTEEHILPLEILNEAPYAKLFFATKQQIMDIVERDKNEIRNQILAEIDTTEIVYLEQALEMLKLKEQKIKMYYEQPKNNDAISEQDIPTVLEKQEVSNKKLDWFDVDDEGATCLEAVENKMESLNIQSNLNPDAIAFECDINENPVEEFPLIECPSNSELSDESIFTDIDKQNQTKYFYFYQAEDGQQVFLNSFNVRVLNASWGVLAAAPSVIRGRVLHRDTYSLNDQTRKHMPYTAHLPLHCSFDIVELDLQPPHVTNEALGNFAAELDRRARNRAKHERDERRRERAYRRLMEGPPKPDFSSELLFPSALPTYGSPPNPPYGSPPYMEVPLSNLNQSPTMSTVLSPQMAQASPSTSSSSTGLSFAKMASASGTWRVRKTVTPPPPAPANEDESSGPRALVLSDAIEAALLATSPTSKPSGKKNKKSKQKVLFATGMHRAL